MKKKYLSSLIPLILASGYGYAGSPACEIKSGVIAGSCSYSGNNTWENQTITVKNYPGETGSRLSGGVYFIDKGTRLTVGDNTDIRFVVDNDDLYKYGYLFDIGSGIYATTGADDESIIINGHKTDDNYSVTLTSNNGNLIKMSGVGRNDDSFYITGAKIVLNNDFNNGAAGADLAGINITSAKNKIVDIINDSYIESNVDVRDLGVNYSVEPIIQIMSGGTDIALLLDNTTLNSNKGQEIYYSAGGKFVFSNGRMNYNNPGAAGVVMALTGTAAGKNGDGGYAKLYNSIINIKGGKGTAFALGSRTPSSQDGSNESKMDINHTEINVDNGWYGFQMNNGTQVNITNSSVINMGNGSGFIFTDQHWGKSVSDYTYMDKFISKVNIENSQINAYKDVFAFYNNNKAYNDSDSYVNANVTTNNSVVKSDGYLVNIDARRFTNINGYKYNNNISFILDATKSDLTGDINIKSEDNSKGNGSITLDSSSLTGKTSVSGYNANLSLNLKNNSKWIMTDDSYLNKLNLDNSNVYLSDKDNPNWKNQTLTVDSFSGNDGTLYFNGKLNGDKDTLVDNLIVNKEVTGKTNISVNNLGGKGAQTIEGIKLINVKGSVSDDAFVQKGRIVAGGYDYTLEHSDNYKDWYLTSKNYEPTPPTPPTPDNKVRPEAASYIANLAAANTLFSTRLHDRLGETEYIDVLTGEKRVTSLWLRQVEGHNSWRDSSGQLKTQSNSYVTQLGGDVAQWSTDGLSRGHLGLMTGYANSHNQTYSSVTGYDSKGSISGYSAGVYGTWFANDAEKSGLYVDSWLQYSWFNNYVNGEQLASESYKSKGLTASLETGYALKVGEFTGSQGTLNEWFIQPQAQATWMGVKAEKHCEDNGTRVNSQGDGNVQTRLGMRAYLKSHHAMDEGEGRTFEPFIEANWLHNTRSYGVKMDDVRISQAGARNIGEVKVGVEGQINPRLNLWGNVGVQVGDKGYNDSTAMVGVKYNF